MHRFVTCVTLGGERLLVTYAIQDKQQTHLEDRNFECYKLTVIK